MAGIDNIKGRILNEAETKASEIIKDAEAMGKEVLAKAKEEASNKSNEIEQKFQYEANEKKRIIHSMVELEIRKDILSAKQEVLCKVFDEVQNRINALTGEEYEKILISMLIETVQSGQEEIVLSKKDESRISSDFITKVNDEFKKKGKTVDIKLSMEDVDFGGGLL